MGCTPSAVSLQVKQLEQYFGQPLFDRSTRVVRPTPFAVEVTSAASEFTDRLQALRSRPSLRIEGKFRLGVITSMQSDLLPDALRILRDRHNALEVRIPPLNDTDELLTELRAGRIDAALVVRPESGGSTRFVWHEVNRQPYVMLAPPDSAETDPRSLLKTRDWIAYDTGLPGGRVAARHARLLLARCLERRLTVVCPASGMTRHVRHRLVGKPSANSWGARNRKCTRKFSPVRNRHLTDA